MLHGITQGELQEDPTHFVANHLVEFFHQLGMNKFAAIISLVVHEPKSPEFYKKLLLQHEELAHVTIEICRCDSEYPLAS